jgi:hypothetical protein
MRFWYGHYLQFFFFDDKKNCLAERSFRMESMVDALNQTGQSAITLCGICGSRELKHLWSEASF